VAQSYFTLVVDRQERGSIGERLIETAIRLLLFSMAWEKIIGKRLIAKDLYLSISPVRTYICNLLHMYPLAQRFDI
jgi:hypothetical protein